MTKPTEIMDYDALTREGQLLLRVMDDWSLLKPFIYQLYQLTDCQKVCRYLIVNGLTGRKLHEWMKFHYGMSLLAPLKEIIRRMENAKTVRPIIGGKDYRV